MSETPETENRLRFYRRAAEAGSLMSAGYSQTVLEELYRGLQKAPIRSICDVGSGTGCNLALLSRCFPSARIVAMDLSLWALQQGLSQMAEAEPCVADAQHLPLAAGAVDLAVCTEVLEHVADLGASLRELGRIVRERGFCIVSSPNYFNPMGLRKWMEDRRRGAEYWDPWGGHPGYERLMTPWLVRRAVPTCFKTCGVRGAGFLMAWSALGYRRVGSWNDRWPLLAVGRLPGLRNLGINRYLLLQRRESGR